MYKRQLQRFTISPLLCLGLLAELRVDGLSLDVMCPFVRRLTMFPGQLVPFEVRQRLFPVTDNVTGCVDLYAYVD